MPWTSQVKQWADREHKTLTRWTWTLHPFGGRLNLGFDWNRWPDNGGWG